MDGTLKSYCIAKHVIAKPMTRSQYCEHTGEKLINGEDGEEKGFLFEDQNWGVKSNHPKHFGFVTWNPENVFLASSTKLNPLSEVKKDLQPHQERVVKEQIELAEKFQSFSDFMKKDFYKVLDFEEQIRLKKQYMAMMAYNSILIDRINNF